MSLIDHLFLKNEGNYVFFFQISSHLTSTVTLRAFLNIYRVSQKDACFSKFNNMHNLLFDDREGKIVGNIDFEYIYKQSGVF